MKPLALILAIYTIGAVAFWDITRMCAPGTIPPSHYPRLILAPVAGLVMWPAVVIGGCNRTFEK